MLCCQYSSIHLCASVYLSKNITVHSVLRNTLRNTQNLPFIFSRLRSITACHLCLNGLSKAVIDRHRILHMEWLPVFPDAPAVTNMYSLS